MTKVARHIPAAKPERGERRERHPQQEAKGVVQKIMDRLHNEMHAEGAETAIFVSPFHEACYKILHAPFFEHTVCAFILGNFVLIVYDTDLNARDEHSPAWTAACYWTILMVFVMESLLRLIVLRSKFWWSPMNVWDLLVVCVDLSLSAQKLVTSNSGLVGVSIARFLRLLRLIRATKALTVFPELRLMMLSLSGAFSSIVWGTLLLIFALIMWGVLAVQLIHPLNLEVAASGAYDGCDRCARAYASTWEATLTFTTQIVCGDSWSRETVPVITAFPATLVFFMGVFLTVGMALTNLILGVVLNSATEARENIVHELAQAEQTRTLGAKNRLLDICEAMDEDGSGELSSHEIQEGFHNNEEFKDTIQHLGIRDKSDLDVVWYISDIEKSGSVSYKEFVSQIYLMNSSEMEYMLAYVKYYITQIRHDIFDKMDAGKEFESEIDKEFEQVNKAEGELRASIDQILDQQGSAVGETPTANHNNNNNNMTSSDVLCRPDVDPNDVKAMASSSNQDAKVWGETKLNERLPVMQSTCASFENETERMRSSEPLHVSQLQVLRRHFLTTCEEMRRAHVEMLENTMQTMGAPVTGSVVLNDARSSSTVLLM